MGYKKSLKILRERKNELSEEKKFKLAHKINRYWRSPKFCENCFEEVNSISRDPASCQVKWLCEKCEESVIEKDKDIEGSIPI